MKGFFLTFSIFFVVTQAFSQSYSLRGKVTALINGEALVGASVRLSSGAGTAGKETSVGLDGSYSFKDLRPDSYHIEVQYIGFQPSTSNVQITSNSTKDFTLSPSTQQLSEVHIQSRSAGTDAEARALERQARNVLNIISAKQIQLSPDITVANVIQRVSGLSIERNANGDPQYAIVRGMDKRYNNTLVNGIKIPSPDNDNRFVPLDIFPAVFLDRLEVHKSLTADMEADAIGGTVNMVMKDAPSVGRILDADLQVGYNQMNVDGDFSTYNRSQVYKQSPSELFGPDYEAVPGDFPAQNMVTNAKQPLPDIIANVTYGDRFIDQKLGVMLGGSFQNSYRPASYYSYDPEVDNTAGNPVTLEQLIERRSSAQQQRIALHGKLGYDVNEHHKIGLYAGQYLLNEFRVREQVMQDVFQATTGYPVYPTTRVSNTYQTIGIADLNGQHQLAPALQANWHVVYSHARNDRPDDGVLSRTANYNAADDSYEQETVYFQGVQNSRTWERNTDQDISAYANFSYKPKLVNDQTEFSFGGLYRSKTRDNYYNYYNYNVPVNLPGVRGVDWFTFADIDFDAMANPFGDGNNSNMVYDAHERIAAYYLNTDWQFNKTHVQAGLRVEHTQQGYTINPTSAKDNDTDLEGKQTYSNLFPSVSIKQQFSPHTDLKATYYKGISRPGFFEIVPTIRSMGGGDSFYSERGNPELKPTVGHNADLRYEYFPSLLDQLLVGVFYKRLINPIEYGFPKPGTANEKPQTNRILPENFGTATNYGAEVDITKYFSRFGVRANYTYTHSRVSSTKVFRNSSEGVDSGEPAYAIREQSRPLQGQSNHVANLSLLFKDQQRRWDVQLVFNYTGERIALVSPYYETDQWMRPMTVLDLSIEKGIGSRIEVFVKANNLLNTPYQLIVDKPLAFPDDPYPHQDDPNKVSNIRRDQYGQSYRLGVRYRLFQ